MLSSPASAAIAFCDDEHFRVESRGVNWAGRILYSKDLRGPSSPSSATCDQRRIASRAIAQVPSDIGPGDFWWAVAFPAALHAAALKSVDSRPISSAARCPALDLAEHWIRRNIVVQPGGDEPPQVRLTGDPAINGSFHAKYSRLRDFRAEAGESVLHTGGPSSLPP